MWSWLNSNATQLGLILGVVPIFWGVYSFVAIKKAETKQRRFENYHRLIKDLVQGDGEAMKADRRLAVIFELKNYPDYAPATEKILRGFQSVAERLDDREIAHRLIDQISETLKALDH